MARIDVRLDQPLGRVDRRIFGSFTEHPEPYRVRYWGLGNEMYGDWQIGQLTANGYVTRARQWAKALRRLDPDICLISCGQTGVDEWDRVVIDGLTPFTDSGAHDHRDGHGQRWAHRVADLGKRPAGISISASPRIRSPSSKWNWHESSPAAAHPRPSAPGGRG